MPEQMEQFRQTCTACGKAVLTISRMLMGGMTNAERADAVKKHAAAAGWSINPSIVDRSILDVHCPECVAVLARPLTLPTFDVTAACPMCGHGDVSTMFCTGRDGKCLSGVTINHLHRTCQRCTYDFVQATLADGVQRDANDRMRSGDGIKRVSRPPADADCPVGREGVTGPVGPAGGLQQVGGATPAA